MMLSTSVLSRVFIHTIDGKEVRLTDPSDKMNVEAVRNFFANTYPILTTAKIEGPTIKDDEIQYRFVSDLGTKG